MSSSNVAVNYKDVVCEGKNFFFDGQHFVLQDFSDEPFYDDALKQYELDAVVKCVETGSVGSLKLYFADCGALICASKNGHK